MPWLRHGFPTGRSSVRPKVCHLWRRAPDSGPQVQQALPGAIHRASEATTPAVQKQNALPFQGSLALPFQGALTLQRSHPEGAYLGRQGHGGRRMDKSRCWGKQSARRLPESTEVAVEPMEEASASTPAVTVAKGSIAEILDRLEEAIRKQSGAIEQQSEIIKKQSEAIAALNRRMGGSGG
ncbi:hypothetical protein MTO96_046942 [Rhipicephalus appendiculatus]